jgi:hypothetical protein
VEKYCRADRPEMKIWRMRIACWIPKATNTNSPYVIFIDFHYNNGCMKAPQYYVTLSLPALLTLIFHGTGSIVCYDSETTKYLVNSKKSLCSPGHALRPVGGTESQIV